MNAQRFLVECWLGFKASSTHACTAESIWKCFKREVDAVLAIWMKTDHCIRTEASSLETRGSHQQFEQSHHWYECFMLWGLLIIIFLFDLHFMGLDKPSIRLKKMSQSVLQRRHTHVVCLNLRTWRWFYLKWEPGSGVAVLTTSYLRGRALVGFHKRFCRRVLQPSMWEMIIDWSTSWMSCRVQNSRFSLSAMQDGVIQQHGHQSRYPSF